MSTEVVGPVPTIRFHDGTKQPFDVPHNTLDPRYKSCTDHHPACICREAELNEYISELRNELKYARDAAAEVLAGHRTFNEDSYSRTFVEWRYSEPVWTYEYDPGALCSCTGCQIARKAHLV